MTNAVVQVICSYKQSALLRNVTERKKMSYFFGQESNQTTRKLCKTYNIVHIFFVTLFPLFTSKSLLMKIFLYLAMDAFCSFYEVSIFAVGSINALLRKLKKAPSRF